MGICIRGAVTAENTKEDILAKTKELLLEIIHENKLETESITAVFFTATRIWTRLIQLLVQEPLALQMRH